MIDWLKRLHRFVFLPDRNSPESAPRHWMQRLDEPFFGNRGEAESYLTRELATAIPDDWAVSHMPGTLDWQLHPKTSASFLREEYSIAITRSLDYIIWYYDNNDAG